jgi:hypothetical protein
MPALNFYRCGKLRNPFTLSFSGNKSVRWEQDISRRLAGTQHLPASLLPSFMNLQLKWQSEGGQVSFFVDAGKGYSYNLKLKPVDNFFLKERAL